MHKPQSDIRWLFQQAREVFSWTGVGWIVALIAGVWGMLISIDQFIPAYILLVVMFLLSAFKWGQVTGIHTAQRRVGAFIFGAAILTVAAFLMFRWSSVAALASKEEAKKLEPLKDIPSLRAQIADLLPLKKRVRALQSDYQISAQQASDREQIIEGLDRILIKQGASLQSLGLKTDLDLFGEPASSADIVAGPNALDPSDALGEGNAVMVINTGKRRMEEVTLTVSELIRPNDPEGVTLRKIKEAKSHFLGSIPAGKALQTGIKLPYFPPQNYGWAFSVACKGGGSSETVYRTVDSPGGKSSVHVERYVNGKQISSRSKRP